jgi:hypothetical protein
MIYRNISITPYIHFIAMKKIYNCARHDECPPSGCRIGFHSLQHRHIVFDSFGFDSARSVVDGLLFIGGLALAVRLRLDLRCRSRLLVNDVIHADELWRRHETATRLGFKYSNPVTTPAWRNSDLSSIKVSFQT